MLNEAQEVESIHLLNLISRFEAEKDEITSGGIALVSDFCSATPEEQGAISEKIELEGHVLELIENNIARLWKQLKTTVTSC